MEKYFNINYEFSPREVGRRIDEQLSKNESDYICVADGVILNNANRKPDYLKIVNGGMFAICDSGYVPLYIKWLYGKRYPQYCGSQIFKDLVSSQKYRMFFMGTNQRTLDGLKENLKAMNPKVENMSFYELPFKAVDEFDYPAIAKMVNEDGADIIWVALGAPKQEMFMNRLQPYLHRGVMFGFGAIFNFNAGVGNVRRAPNWMLKLKLEWLHRAFEDPKKNVPRYWNFIKTLPRLIKEEMKRDDV